MRRPPKGGPQVRILPFPPYSRLAQRVERGPDKTEVTGAVPVSTTIKGNFSKFFNNRLLIYQIKIVLL